MQQPTEKPLKVVVVVVFLHLVGLYYAGSQFHPLASPVQTDGPTASTVVRQQTENPQDELSMFSVGNYGVLATVI